MCIYGVQKKASDPLDLKWVLGSELRYSARAACTPHC